MLLPHDASGPNSAPTLVLLHGGGVGRWMWAEVVTQLEREYHCLVPDLPEHGALAGSDGPPFKIDAAGRLVAELIEARAHGGRAHLAGLSLGAQVGVAMLRLAPERVDRAVLSGVLAVRPGSRPWWAPAIGPMLRLYAPFKDLGFMIRANQRSLAIPDRYAEPFARDTRRIGTHALGRIFAANLSFELPLDPIPRDRPTLLLAGEKERAMVKEATRELGGRVQGAAVGMVRDGVHNWPLVQPVLFARVLRAWLTNADLPAELVALR